MVSSHKRAFRGTGGVPNWGFRISDFEFTAFPSGWQAGRPPHKGSEGVQDSSGMGNLALLATRSASSTVDKPQSATKAIFHSYLSESLAGRSPSWLSEGGWAGGGGGELEFESDPPLRFSPPSRRRRVAISDGGTDERLCSEGTPSEIAWPRALPADGGRTRRKKRPPVLGGRGDLIVSRGPIFCSRRLVFRVWHR